MNPPFASGPGHLAQRAERPISNGASVRGFVRAWLDVDPLRELEPFCASAASGAGVSAAHAARRAGAAG